MYMLLEIVQTFVATCRDVFPVLALIVGFQFIILRQPIPNLRQVVVGFGFVLIGLTLFLVGLEKALFPLGKKNHGDTTLGSGVCLRNKASA